VIVTEEVERRVQAAVQALSDIPAPERSLLGEEQRVAARFQLGGRTALINVFVAACVATVVVLALVFGPLGSRGPSSSSKGPSAHPSRSALTPKGWKTYTYGKAAISVPRNWSFDTCPAPSAAGTLDLGPLKMVCTDVDNSNTNSVTLMSTTVSLRQIERSGDYCIVTVNRLTVALSPCTSSNPDGLIVWTIPSLGIAASAFQKGSGTVGFLTVSLVNRVLRTIRQR
jgi:hypothetical protein